MTILYYFAFFLFRHPRVGLITGALPANEGIPVIKQGENKNPNAQRQGSPLRAPPRGAAQLRINSGLSGNLESPDVPLRPPVAPCPRPPAAEPPPVRTCSTARESKSGPWT